MWRRLQLVHGAQCYVLLKNLCPSELLSANFPNTLPMQQLEDLRVIYQSQVTCRSLSYEAFFLSSATVPGETFHCAKSLLVVQEEGPSEDLFYNNPDPPPPEIQNLTSNHMPQGTIFRMAFSTPTIEQNEFSFSGKRGWRLMKTCNNTPIMFPWSTILLLTHFLRDRHGGGVASIAVLW